MEWFEIVARIVAGLSVVIPLVVQLVKYVKLAIKEKNWGVVLNKVIGLMETAEQKFTTGADRKEWVLSMLKSCADGINYDMDYDAIGEMIDSLCAMSKVINPSQKTGA